MSDGTKEGSGNPPAASSGTTAANQASSDIPPSDKPVSYETHRKLLKERKEFEEELTRLRTEKADKEKKDLEDRGEFQKIAQNEKQRADEAAAKLAEYEQRFEQAKKLKAFLGALGSEVDEKFFGFLPVEQIAIDPETREINMTSVAKAAETFKTQYPELLRSKTGVKLPSAAPQGNSSGTISRSEWLGLPEKEMRKYKPHQIIE